MIKTIDDEAVEKNFQKEDADAQPQARGSFVSEDVQKKEGDGKPVLTMSDLFMYIAKHVKEMHGEITAIREYLEKQKIAPSMPPVPIQPTVGSPEQPQTTFAPQAIDAGLEKVRKSLAEFIVDGSIEVIPDELTMYYIIRTKKFLGAENFAKIAKIVREDLGGEYISQGKASHFKVPKGSK